MPARKSNLFGFGKSKRLVRSKAELASIAEEQKRATDAYLRTGVSRARRGSAPASTPRRHEAVTSAGTSYKGYSIKLTEGGDYVIPKLDPDSHFDSLKDAKAFLDSWKRNPEIRKAVKGARGAGKEALKFYDSVSGTIWNWTGGIPRKILGTVVGENPQRNLTDRAKRYRAQNEVTGPKQCVLCKSKRNVDVMHLDGNESNGEPANLAYGCRSCNGKLAAAFKRIGAGVKTRQYNPSTGVPSFEQYAWAVSQHSRGAHDEGGVIIHATPKHKRIEYAQMIADLKRSRGTSGGDMPDWVNNPLPPRWDIEALQGGNWQTIGSVRSTFIQGAVPAYRREHPGWSKNKKLRARSQERNPSNPQASAERMYESFHGKPAEGEKHRNNGAVMTPAQRAFDVAHRKQQAAMKKYFALREKRDNSQYPSTRWDSFDRKATAQLRHVSRLGNEEDKILESIGGISALINPQASAERMYESFHGKPAEGETIIEEEFHEHEYLAPLGVLVNFKVATLSGFDDLIGTDDATAERQDYDETAANADTIFLAVNEDGTQLYFRGGDQSLPLEKFKMGESTDWYRDDMIVGVLYEITYRTKKKFDKFKLTDYYHQLGEETGDQPMLRYDPLSPHLYVSGGKYKIKMPLIGVSPGIEN